MSIYSNPGPKEPATESFWGRGVRLLMGVLDIVVLVLIVSCFFTWHDINAQPASAWPKRFTYLFFLFSTVYGFRRGLTENRARHWIGVVTFSFGVSAFLFYGTASPPSLIVRLSAAFDQSKAVPKKFEVVNEHARGAATKSYSGAENYYYTLTDPEDPDHGEWELYLGRPEPMYNAPPSYWILNYHHSTFGVDWIDRSERKPIYELERFLDYNEAELSSLTVAFVYLGTCYSALMDTFLGEWAREPNRRLLTLENFRFGDPGCKQQKALSAPHRIGIQCLEFLQSIAALRPELAYVRCPDGRLLVFNISAIEGRQAFSASCGR